MRNYGTARRFYSTGCFRTNRTSRSRSSVLGIYRKRRWLDSVSHIGLRRWLGGRRLALAILVVAIGGASIWGGWSAFDKLITF